MNRTVTTTGFAAVSLTIAALATGTASAQPAEADNTVTVEILPGVRYTGNASTQTARITTAIGSMTTDAGSYEMQNIHGDNVFGSMMPGTLPGSSNTAPAPPALAVARDTSSPTAGPSADVAAAGEAAPRDREADINAAVGVVATNFGLATGVGAMAGGVTGAAIGCGVGAVTGGLAAVPTTLATLSLPAAALGCLIGAGTIGGVGAVVGGAVVGAPVGIATAVNQYNKLHAQGDL